METLVHFYNFIEELQQSNSRNYKIETLKKYKDDEDIKYYLNFLYNPYITTGISSKSYQRFHDDNCIDSYPDNIFNSTKEALEYLKSHNTSDYNTRELMFSFYMRVASYSIHYLDNLELSDLFYKLITKNLPLGIDTLTINKCIPNLIPTFAVQLSNKYFEKPEVVEGKDFAITTKIDGGRIIALKENGIVSFYTRAGQRYEGLVDLEQEMLTKLPDNICLDGEITLLNKGNLTSKDQYKETMKITRKDGEKHGVKILVFDCMTAEEFRNQHCDTPYFIRRDMLIDYFSKYYTEKYYNSVDVVDYSYKQKLFEYINQDYTYFTLLPVLYQGNDTEKIMEWLNYNVNQGEEGIMINLLDAPYEFKRTNNLLKCKLFQSYDMEIVGLEEGSNSNVGKLGAFLVRYKNGNIVKVGSGLTKQLREEVWKDKDSYIGQIIEVGYFEETHNSDGGESLRFPTFKAFRTDKEADF